MIKLLKVTILLLLVLQLSLFSQRGNRANMPNICVIKGTVIDSINNAPIQYASLSLVSSRTNKVVGGGITNESGKFDIRKIPFGKSQLVVEYIGFKPIIMKLKFTPRGDTELDLGTFKLQGNAIEMDEVQIEGERPLFVQTMDKRTFNVAQNTISSGGSALDALRQVPGVEVDIDGNVSLRGSANINILIDGKPSTMSGGETGALLDNISADNLEDIEIITNPSAKYDPEGMAGIINIILKENKLAGLNGNIKGGLTTNNGMNASGQLNFKQETLNIYVNAGVRDNIRGGAGKNYRETYVNGDTTYLDQTIDSERGGNSLSLKTGTDYDINDKNTIGFSVSWNNRLYTSARDVMTDKFLDTVDVYILDSKGKRDRESLDYSLTYDKKFTNPKQTLNLLAHSSEGTYFSIEQTGSSDGVHYPDSTTTNFISKNINYQLDYIHPFSKTLKLETGLKSSSRSIDNEYSTYVLDGAYTKNKNASNHFIYDETIHSGYALIGLKRNAFSGQVGVRGEYAEIVSELKDTGEIYNNPYTSIYPSASFSIGPRVMQLMGSYSHRVNRPRTRQLNPSIKQIDPVNLRFGNPSLKPEYIDVFELTLSRFIAKKSISIGTYYRHTTDMIQHYKYIEDGISNVTYKNFDKKISYGAEFILSGKMTPKLRVMMNANLYFDEVNANNIVDSYTYTSKGVNGRFTTTYVMTPTSELMLTGFYRAPRNIPFGTIESMGTASLSFKKRFIKDKLALSLQIRDIFNTMKFEYETGDEYYFQHSQRQWQSQVASISLQYRFGKIDDKSRYGKRERSSRSRDESSFEIE